MVYVRAAACVLQCVPCEGRCAVIADVLAQRWRELQDQKVAHKGSSGSEAVEEAQRAALASATARQINI